jgi:predicted permease
MLMVRTMRSLAAIDLGFNPDHVVSADMPMPFPPLQAGLENARAIEAAAIEEVKRLPGVLTAGVGGNPLWLSMGTTGLTIPGDPRRLGMVGVSPVGAGYFDALGARLIAGRFFGPQDRPGSPNVAILSEAAAHSFWPGGSAVGRTLLLESTPLEIVGVIANIRGWEFDEGDSGSGLFVVNNQSQYFGVDKMIIKTAGDPQSLVPAIKSIVRRVNPQQPFPGVEPLQDRIDLRTAPRRFILRIVGLFSVLGLLLAVIGIYGVLAESVAERVPEIGVRMALGAAESDVMKLILGQAAWIVVCGLAIGLAGALLLHDQMKAMVFGVRTLDPLAYAVACAVLVVAAMAACAIPARRAAKLDPVVALRTE